MTHICSFGLLPLVLDGTLWFNLSSMIKFNSTRGGATFSLVATILLTALAAIVIVPLFLWFGCRIEVPNGQMAVLSRKTGADPAPGTIISSPDEKGLQLDVLSEGRYFYNPFFWDWEYHPLRDIPPGSLGVVFRRYGADLPPGDILAKDGTKGILADPLSPGKHRFNPYAYEIQEFPATPILPGQVGVMVSLVGADPLTGKPEKVNTFIVGDNEKGVIEKTLDPGTHYLNPYLFSVVPVNLQSNRFELSGDDAIDFLTMDGFPVRVEGTVEYAIRRDKAALLTHEVGDNEDILKKIILPRARGFARIEGSKGNALNYIVGEMRQEFQDNLTKNLREGCGKWGVEIRSVLIRNISPPEEISSIIQDRELAKQAATMFVQQIVQAKSKAELAKQKGLAEQNKEKVDAETEKLKATIQASQEAQVRQTAAEQNLAVAKLQKDAAVEQAAAIRAKAEGEQTVIRAKNEAIAKVLNQNAQAFSSGDAYAKFLLYTKLAGNIENILTNDNPEGIAGIITKMGESTPQNNP